MFEMVQTNNNGNNNDNNNNHIYPILSSANNNNIYTNLSPTISDNEQFRLNKIDDFKIILLLRLFKES